jgi:hypothetical protein
MSQLGQSQPARTVGYQGVASIVLGGRRHVVRATEWIVLHTVEAPSSPDITEGRDKVVHGRSGNVSIWDRATNVGCRVS